MVRTRTRVHTSLTLGPSQQVTAKEKRKINKTRWQTKNLKEKYITSGQK